jgi:predicted DNA-binding transcriptional regulator YafY
LNDYNNKLYTIPLDRIVDMQEIRKDFIPNTTIDIDEYFKDIIGTTKEIGPIENIRLQFSEHRFPYVETKPIHGSQKIIDHGKRIIEINVIPNKELKSHILSFGNDVEVLSPQKLREEIRGIIEDSLGRYSVCR